MPPIILTRARGENTHLARLLASHAPTAEVPLIAFSSLPPPPQAHTHAGWIILTSPQGAKRYLQTGMRHLHLAAVGESTAEPLWNAGLTAFIPSRANAQTLAAELPTTPQTVLHLTSDIASHTLQKGLLTRGFSYERAALYCTSTRALTKKEEQLLLGANVITLASGSAASSLARYGTHFSVATLGEQTTHQAQALGFRHIAQARHPTLESLAEATLSLLLTDDCSV